MTHKIEGIIPVMLTPFTDQVTIGYPGLERLIEWYLDKGVPRQSEMADGTPAERYSAGSVRVSGSLSPPVDR
jgi:dihydrodipicolinate synthase/N-acetylneuraminate lyase